MSLEFLQVDPHRHDETARAAARLLMMITHGDNPELSGKPLKALETRGGVDYYVLNDPTRGTVGAVELRHDTGGPGEVRPKATIVSEVAVDPSARDMRYGTTILACAAAIAEQRGDTEVRITPTSNDNRRLYERLGFAGDVSLSAEPGGLMDVASEQMSQEVTIHQLTDVTLDG